MRIAPIRSTEEQLSTLSDFDFFQVIQLDALLVLLTGAADNSWTEFLANPFATLPEERFKIIVPYTEGLDVY